MEHSVEIDFEIFEKVVNIIGGAYVDISQEELDYLQDNYPYTETLTVGENKLDGFQALCYARMRKVGHGDYERTERQREVITSLLNNLRNLGIMDIHKMFTEVLPLICTDMTNTEMTNYAFEFIPMLKDLKIQSQRIPFDGTGWSVGVDMGTYIDSQIDCNAKENGRRLRQSIGMEEPETTE